MTVEVKYIVKRKGKEVMSSVSQKEANAYDKMLDISDELTMFLEDKFSEVLGENINEQQMEEICFYGIKKRNSIKTFKRSKA